MKQFISILFTVLYLLTVPTTAVPTTTTKDYIEPATADKVVVAVAAAEQPTVAETTIAVTEAPTEETEPAENTEEPIVISYSVNTEDAAEDDATKEESYDYGSAEYDSDYDYDYDYDYEANETESYAANSTDYSDYSDYDLDLLSRVICVEAGCEWIPDWVQLYVGSVVLNRVNSSMYPNSIEGVLYDPGQYNPYTLYNYTPDERTIANARQLLESGSILPADVLGQNGECTGDGVYDSYYDSILGSTIYFTYVYGY